MCLCVVTQCRLARAPSGQTRPGGLGGGGPQSPLLPSLQQPGNMGWGHSSELREAQTCRVQGSLGTPPLSQMEELKPREVQAETGLDHTPRRLCRPSSM